MVRQSISEWNRLATTPMSGQSHEDRKKEARERPRDPEMNFTPNMPGKEDAAVPQVTNQDREQERPLDDQGRPMPPKSVSGELDSHAHITGKARKEIERHDEETKTLEGSQNAK
ncbi:hypothetical protein EON65_11680 [archaeon]|nr:MAG: hypothetical protein EON65_11680 [archaeon]